MLEKINKLINLQRELDEKYGMYSVRYSSSTGSNEVAISTFEKFDELAEIFSVNEIIVSRECDEFPYKRTFNHDGINFYKLMTKKEYEKSRANDTTQESTSIS